MASELPLHRPCGLRSVPMVRMAHADRTRHPPSSNAEIRHRSRIRMGFAVLLCWQGGISSGGIHIPREAVPGSGSVCRKRHIRGHAGLYPIRPINVILLPANVTLHFVEAHSAETPGASCDLASGPSPARRPTKWVRTRLSIGRSRFVLTLAFVANRSRSARSASADRSLPSAPASSKGSRSWRVSGGVALSRYSKAVPLRRGSSVWSARKAMRTASPGSSNPSSVNRCSRFRSARSRSWSSKNHCYFVGAPAIQQPVIRPDRPLERELAIDRAPHPSRSDHSVPGDL
jgi:hypothetical protein